MASSAMHGNEIEITLEAVRSLVDTQFPEFADRRIERVVSSGTDNAMYRLGEHLAVRLPRIGWAIDMVAKEQTWLPVLAPQLPLSIPRPVGEGAPSDDFPYPWTIVEWLPGELASRDSLTDPINAARTLANFVRSLQDIDASGGPTHERGGPVRTTAQMVHQGLAGLQGEVDPVAVERAWKRVLDVSDYTGPPRWFHGDLAHLNLLAHDGLLTSVIDWGTCGVGDPAIDTRVAWNLLDRDARETYRAAAGFDDETWERGKGWVLNGVYGISYYRHTNPALVHTIVKGIQAILDEPS